MNIFIDNRPISSLSPTPAPLQTKAYLPHPTTKREALPSLAKARDGEGKNEKKAAKGRRSDVIMKSDEELVEGFVMKGREELKGMRVDELRSLLKGIESLKKFCRVKKEMMVERYMEWQEKMEERASRSSARPPASPTLV
jgi:hypothetical protein